MRKHQICLKGFKGIIAERQSIMVKKNIIHLVHAAVFLAVLGLVLMKVSDVFERKDSQNKYNEFFEDPEAYDVIFLGSSHVHCGILPMELYKDYGIAAYNCGNSGSSIKETYYTFKNILDYNTPKLIVIDTYFLGPNESNFVYVSNGHKALDAFPITKTKIDTISSLYTDTDEQIEMLIPFVRYHSRWNELRSQDFSREQTTIKGEILEYAVANGVKTPEIIDTADYDDSWTLGKEYLEKLIGLAKSKGIEVLITTIPYPANVEEQLAQNYAYKLSQEYDVNYLNLLEISDLINYNTDMGDATSHLNRSGALKVTSYLGDYIVNHYDIADRRYDEAYKTWEQNYESYVNINIQALDYQTNINTYLMLLTNKELECSVNLNDSVTEDKYPLIYQLINNIDGMELCGEGIWINIADKSRLPDTTRQYDADVHVVVYRKGTTTIVSEKSFSMK